MLLKRIINASQIMLGFLHYPDTKTLEVGEVHFTEFFGYEPEVTIQTTEFGCICGPIKTRDLDKWSVIE